MSITSSSITITVEPKVSSLVVSLKNVIMSGSTETVTVTALDSSGKGIPGVSVELYGYAVSMNISQSSNINIFNGGATKVATRTTNAQGYFSVDVDLTSLGTFAPESAESAVAFQAYVSVENLLSNIAYSYPLCTIEISSNETEVEVGESFTLTATVNVPNGGGFGVGSTTYMAFEYFEGYAQVTFQDSAGPYTPVYTNSSGKASVTLDTKAQGTETFTATANGQ